MPRGGGRSSSRSSGGGRSFFGGRSSTPPRQQAPPRQQYQQPRQQAPQMHQQSMPMQPQRPGMMSGLGGTLATGMALGAGSAVGHEAVRSLMGGSGGHGGNHQQGQNEEMPQQQQQFDNQQPLPQTQSYNGNMNMDNKCMDFSNIFNDCMKYNMNNSKVCEQTFEDLKKCQSNI